MECRLESAHDLAAVLAALQLREKDQKDQRVDCEASVRGLKIIAQSAAKEVAIFGWLFKNAFKDYVYSSAQDAIHLRLPLAPLISCLQIFSDKAALLLRCPDGQTDVLHFTLEEEGAVTECHVRTLVLDQAPAPITTFFAPGEPFSMIRPIKPESWHLALSEFIDLDAPDVILCVTLRDVQQQPPRQGDAQRAAVSLRALTVNSDVEVELPREGFDDFVVAPSQSTAGEVAHRYPLTSVLASCLRCVKEAKAIKIRFNREGVMSMQCILRGRGPQDLFCEALVSPLAADDSNDASGNAAARPSRPAEESVCY